VRAGARSCHDAQHYKRGNVIERAFNRLEQWRGIATRYDKYALVYRGAVVGASHLLWLR
jgi:transposase